MARAWFGGGVADFVVSAAAPGDPLRFAAATLTMWDAETGGTQVTDLLLGGVAVTTIPVGTDGAVPSFQGPDGVYALWADGGSGRSRLDAVGSIVEAAAGVTDGLMTAVASNPGSAFAAQQAASFAARVDTTGGGVALAATTPWGIDAAGRPYYDPAGAAAGEKARLHPPSADNPYWSVVAIGATA